VWRRTRHAESKASQNYPACVVRLLDLDRPFTNHRTAANRHETKQLRWLNRNRNPPRTLVSTSSVVTLAPSAAALDGIAVADRASRGKGKGSDPFNHLEQLLGEVDGDEPRAAPHAAEVVAGDVPAELVVVDDHGGERRRRVEEAAVDDDDPDVPGADARLRQHLVDGAEHDGLGLGAGLRHARVRRRVEHGLGEVGALPEPGPLQDLALERQVVAREHPRRLRLPHERLPRHHVLAAGLVAREVHKVHAARALHQVRRREHRAQDQERHGEGRVGGGRGPGRARELGRAVAGEPVRRRRGRGG
jgi:hypothetical protein